MKIKKRIANTTKITGTEVRKDRKDTKEKTFLEHRK